MKKTTSCVQQTRLLYTMLKQSNQELKIVTIKYLSQFEKKNTLLEGQMDKLENKNKPCTK